MPYTQYIKNDLVNVSAYESKISRRLSSFNRSINFEITLLYLEINLQICSSIYTLLYHYYAETNGLFKMYIKHFGHFDQNQKKRKAFVEIIWVLLNFIKFLFYLFLDFLLFNYILINSTINRLMLNWWWWFLIILRTFSLSLITSLFIQISKFFNSNNIIDFVYAPVRGTCAIWRNFIKRGLCILY